MTPFHTIAVPHRDISEGRLTLDVFAADLWEVFKGRGPDEYKDAKQFLKKLIKLMDSRICFQLLKDG